MGGMTTIVGTNRAHWQFDSYRESVDKTHSSPNNSLTAFLGLLTSGAVEEIRKGVKCLSRSLVESQFAS